MESADRSRFSRVVHGRCPETEDGGLHRGRFRVVVPAQVVQWRCAMLATKLVPMRLCTEGISHSSASLGGHALIWRGSGGQSRAMSLLGSPALLSLVRPVLALLDLRILSAVTA